MTHHDPQHRWLSFANSKCLSCNHKNPIIELTGDFPDDWDLHLGVDKEFTKLLLKQNAELKQRIAELEGRQ